MIRYKMELNDQAVNRAAEVNLKTKLYAHKRKVSKTIILVAGLLIVAMNGIRFWNRLIYANVINLNNLILLLIGVLFIITAFRLKSIQKSMILKNLKMARSSNFPTSAEYIFEEDGIRILSSIGEGKYLWKAFPEWGLTDQYCYIIRYDNAIIIVDKAALSPEDWQALLQLLEHNISSVKQ